MPGVLPMFSIVTPAGHQVGVAIGNNRQDVLELRSLECIQCGSINYKGRKIEDCNHTVCQPCVDKDDSLKTGKHDCDGLIVTGKTLTDYSIKTKFFLENLTVFCSVNECNQQAQLLRIDQHIRGHETIVNHSAGEILVANDESELPPNVLWHEHEGHIYYMFDSGAR